MTTNTATTTYEMYRRRTGETIRTFSTYRAARLHANTYNEFCRSQTAFAVREVTAS